MTSASAAKETLVGIPEIAHIAGVQRSAVSNWRKRHPDFPAPSLDTPSGLLFDLALVEQWLIRRGKLSARAAPAMVFWRFVDTTNVQPEALRDFLVAALVYLEASDRAASGTGARIRKEHRWTAIAELDESDAVVGDKLYRALQTIEEDNESLRGLLLQGFQRQGSPTLERQLELVGLLESQTRLSSAPRFDLFEEVVRRTHERARFSEEAATPASIELLLARLARAGRNIFDPACGEGGVLLLAAVADRLEDTPSPLLHGWDRQADTLRIARSRFFLYDVEADFRCIDTLRAAPHDLPMVDTVVLDPPYTVQEWGEPELYADPERWPYGSPPPGSSDTAWLQVAVRALTPGGRAFVLLPAAVLSKSGSEQVIRQALLDAGVVDAVLLLPRRLRRDTSIPLALFCLRHPSDEPSEGSVLLVDASAMGTANRSTVSLDEDEVDILVSVLDGWFVDRGVLHHEPIAALAVPTSKIEGADLRAARYVTEPALDRNRLMAERIDLLGELQVSATRLASALRAIVKDAETQ